MFHHHQIIAAVALLSAGIGVSTPVKAQQPQQGCVSDWTQAAPIVRREGLATIERVGRIMHDKAAGEIINSALCTIEGRYVYRLTVRGGQGRLKTLVVDARQPFGP